MRRYHFGRSRKIITVINMMKEAAPYQLNNKISTGRITYIIAGIILGLLWVISAGTLFILCLTVVCAFLVWHVTPASDKKLIFNLFLVGLLLRLAACFFACFISIIKGHAGWLIGDGWAVNNYSWVLAQYLQNPETVLRTETLSGQIYFDPPYRPPWGGFSGFHFLLTTFYFFFGPLKFSARIINMLLSIISGIFVFDMVKDIFNKKIARCAAILIIFFPSMFIWSLTLLKDPSFIFAHIFIWWGFLKLMTKHKFYYFIVVAVGIIALSSLRKDLWRAELVAVLLAFFSMLRIPLRRKFIILLIPAILIIATPAFKSKVDKVFSSLVRSSVEYSLGINTTPGINYKIFDDKYYYSNPNLGDLGYIKFGKAIIIALLHFFLEPFIWNIRSLAQLIAILHMVMWYLLLIFAIIGIISTFREKNTLGSVLFINIFVMSTAIAMVSGNIGTVFRHRDMITPFVLIFSSVGLVKIFGSMSQSSACAKQGLER